MFNTKLKAKLVALFPEQFEELARELEAETPNPLQEGLAAFQAGDHETAREKLEAAVAAEPYLTQAWVPLGLIYMAQGLHAEAEEHLFQAMCLDAENPKIHYHLGELAQARKDAISAEFCFQKAIDLNPNYTDAYIRLGMTMLEENRLEEATKLFEKAVYLDRKAVVGHYYLAQISMRKQDFKRALVQLHLVKSLKPDYAPAYLMAADIFERIRDFRQAFVELKKAVSLGSANGQVYLRLGKNQLVLKHRENALAFFLEAKNADPALWDAYYHAAAIQEDLNHLEAALQNYEALLGNRKYHEVARMGVFRIRAVLEEMRQAMEGAPQPQPGVIKQFTGPLQQPSDRISA
jgi:tetratricopeptide (TPR) repeat protein